MLLVIILTSIILYKSGAARFFLNKCKLETEPAQMITPEPPPAVEISDREKLEKQAHYILTAQKYEYPETVQYMSETMLIQIINNYCKP